MPVVFLIRHGENDYMNNKILAGRIPGVHLNETGQRQAEQVAGNLKKLPIKAIYSSPLERTWETAVPLAEALNLNIISRQNLLEVDYGEWQGRSYEWLCEQTEWKVLHSTPSLVRFPGGETFFEAQSRICSEIAALCKMHDENDSIACFTHADCIRLALAQYLEMSIDNYQRLFIGPASITTLLIHESNIQLVSMNHGFTFPPQMP
ncbi:MAG: phosphoglycerate mutase [Chloroflexi bacterium]|nr:phosphoglycerate mutase [Chloroflexota bacterium]